MLEKRALALTLCLLVVAAAPGTAPYAAWAAERAGDVPAGVEAPDVAVGAVTVPGLPAAAPGLPADAAGPALAIAPVAADAPAAASAETAAAHPAEAVAQPALAATAPATAAAAEIASNRGSSSARDGRRPSVAWLSGLFDGLRRRKAGPSDPPSVAANAAPRGAPAGSPAALTPASPEAAAPDSAAEPPAPGGPSLSSRADGLAARHLSWWLRPTFALAGALWLQKAAAAAGLALPLDAGMSAAALGSTLLIGASAAALYSAPRALWAVIRREPASPSHAERVQTALAFGVGTLVAAALQVPMGWGLPSMILVGASAAAIVGWTAARQRLAGREQGAARLSLERSAAVVGFAGAVALPAAMAINLLGWLPLSTAWLATLVPAAVLLLDLILAAPRRIYRAFVPKPAADAQRRGLLSGLSATGLTFLALGSAGSVAAVLGPDFDAKIDHFHADENASWDHYSDDGSVPPTPSWQELEAAVARLKMTSDPDAAIADAKRLDPALVPYYDPHQSPAFQKWMHDPKAGPDQRPKEESLALSAEQRRWLIGFVLDPQIVQAPSAAARELVLGAKRHALTVLLGRGQTSYFVDPDYYQDRQPQRAAADPATLQALQPLWQYQERIAAADPAYPGFAFTEQERLTVALKAEFYNLIPNYKTKEGDDLLRRDRAISGVLQRWLDRENFAQQHDLEAAFAHERAAAVHSIPLSNLSKYRGYRAYPKDVIAAVTEAARAHNIPPELLIANLGTQIERRYTLSEGFGVYAQRQTDKTALGRFKISVGRWLESALPRDIAMPVHWNDFLGGVLLNGKNGIGLYQIRPANVRRYPWVWKRFGVPDANALSDREISWRLNDSRYNAEAWACILEGMARDVEALRVKASRGEKLDFSEYKKESEVWLAPSDDQTYAMLPSLASVPQRWWRLAFFHPLLRDKASLQIDEGTKLLASGVLDGRPGALTGILTLDDVKAAAKLLGDKDPYFADAARRGLEAVAADASRPDVARAAAEALARAPKRAASLGLPTAAGVALAAGAVVSKNPRVSRRALLRLGR